MGETTTRFSIGTCRPVNQERPDGVHGDFFRIELPSKH